MCAFCTTVVHKTSPNSSDNFLQKWYLTDRDTICDTDLEGPKEPRTRWGPDHPRETAILRVIRGRSWACWGKSSSQYTAGTQQGQHRYSADSDWGLLDGVHIGGTWLTRLNRPWAAASQPYVNLLWPLVNIIGVIIKTALPALHMQMWPIATDRIAWSVGLSVTLVSPAKTAEMIEMPIGLRTWVGPRNHY